MQIIGIAGAARSGKDTVANVLIERYGYRKDSFAVALRSAACATLGIDLDELDVIKDSYCAVLRCTPRKFMQLMGDEFGRQMVHQNVWVAALAHRASKSKTVIPDLRYENEADFVRSKGGIIIHVTRPGDAIEGRYHRSEAGVDMQDGDCHLKNDGSIGDLEREVFAIVVDASACGSQG